MNTSAKSQWFATTPPIDARLIVSTLSYKALSKTAKITETAGKQHARQALDHFEFELFIIKGDCNYHFLIREPLGATLQLSFLDTISRRSLLIYYVPGSDLPDPAYFG